MLNPLEKHGDGDTVFIPTRQFTLAWTHSIEKQRWEEDYAVVVDGDGLTLRATAARIRGSGAGMEPPAGALLRDGWYHYRPTTPPLAELLLARSRFVADYEWCEMQAAPGLGRHCRPLAQLLPVPAAAGPAGATTRLWPCRSADSRPPR